MARTTAPLPMLTDLAEKVDRWWLMVGWAGNLQLRMLLDAVKQRAEEEARHDRPHGGLLQAPWRHAAIFAIKLVHSFIFLLNSAAIMHIFVAGVRNRPSRWTRAALAVALTEVAVFVANRGRCPLTDLVEHLGAKNGRVSDIFLPRWLADRIPQLCGPPLLIGVLALAWHRCLAARVTTSRRRHGSSWQLTRLGRDKCQVWLE